ncbi:unnamed protein product, partial [Nesidiocoris tenuis]
MSKQLATERKNRAVTRSLFTRIVQKIGTSLNAEQIDIDELVDLTQFLEEQYRKLLESDLIVKKLMLNDETVEEIELDQEQEEIDEYCEKFFILRQRVTKLTVDRPTSKKSSDRETSCGPIAPIANDELSVSNYSPPIESCMEKNVVGFEIGQQQTQSSEFVMENKKLGRKTMDEPTRSGSDPSSGTFVTTVPASEQFLEADNFFEAHQDCDTHDSTTTFDLKRHIVSAVIEFRGRQDRAKFQSSQVLILNFVDRFPFRRFLAGKRRLRLWEGTDWLRDSPVVLFIGRGLKNPALPKKNLQIQP